MRKKRSDERKINNKTKQEQEKRGKNETNLVGETRKFIIRTVNIAITPADIERLDITAVFARFSQQIGQQRSITGKVSGGQRRRGGGSWR
jgi:hypothetical protein